MGISSWASLLVHKWDHLPGRGARKLAKEDENMPTMQSVPNRIAYLGGRIRDGLPFFPFRSDDIELLYPKQFAKVPNSI
jgi:hypothetical protein